MKALGILGIILIVVGIMIIPIAYFAIDLQADTAYAKTFKGQNAMIPFAGSFEDLKGYINIIWVQMNTTFGTANHQTIYSTWWGPDQSYDNSLAATDQWIRNFNTRLDGAIQQWNTMKSNGTTSIYVTGIGMMSANDWYSNQLSTLVNKTEEGGGVCWVIEGAYYKEFYPAAYYQWMWEVPLLLTLWIVGIILVIKAWIDSGY
jgi:hypothetical protein